MDSVLLRPLATSQYERIAARFLIVAFLIVVVGVSIAGGGAANVSRYLVNELSYVAEGLAGKHALGVRRGDPTLPGYFLLLALSGLFLFVHAFARSIGREWWLPGGRLWRWSITHAVVGTLWVLCVIWPQVYLVGIGLVHPAWGIALAGFALEFLVGIVALWVKRSEA